MKNQVIDLLRENALRGTTITGCQTMEMSCSGMLHMHYTDGRKKNIIFV